MSNLFLSNQPTHQRDPSQSRVSGRKKNQPSSRLQHYPSLPNIWIPPHSTPMSNQLPTETKATTVTPSAPSSPKVTFTQPELPVEEKTSTSSPKRHVKYASIEAMLQKTAKKTHTRRRTERDQPHNLLTPPLTPSSSIRTTGSGDVPVKSDSETECVDIVPTDPDSTRLLLISNVNRQITIHQFQSALLDAIIAHRQHAMLTTKYNLPTEVMSGANNRLLVSDGVILILFNDIRVAKIAQEIIRNSGISELQDCVQRAHEGDNTWLSCRFLSVDAAEGMFGPSPTLDEARFFDTLVKDSCAEVDGETSETHCNPIISFGPPGLLSDTRRRFDHDMSDEVVTQTHPSMGPESPHYFYHTSSSGLMTNPSPYEFNDAGLVPSYTQPQETLCMYCPSRGPHTHPHGPQVPFFPRLATPGPSSMYYPIQPAGGPFLPSGFHRAESHTLPPPLQQQFVSEGMMGLPPPMSMMPWPYDPAIAAMSMGPVSVPGMIGGPSHFYPGDYIGANESPYHVPHPYQHQLETIPDSFVMRQNPDQFASSASFVSPQPPHSSRVRNAGLSSSSQTHKGTENNQLSLHRIENGMDTRTTVMIRNIPNKMSDKDIEDYISKVCPRQFDFLYLRIDFSNGCNFGYAFVNFIQVEYLYKFAKERLGAKWNMFSSEKVLQMTYANYQGKEACIEKFKNSCIMDEKEEWRPLIYYSSGPTQGLREPFPAPTHILRKARSSQNRGALHVPGVNSSGHSHAGGDLFHGGPMQQHRHNRRRDGPMGRHPLHINEGKMWC